MFDNGLRRFETEKGLHLVKGTAWSDILVAYLHMGLQTQV